MTGLQKQNVPVPFARGLDTKSDNKQVDLGQALVLENATFQTTGQIRKRYGNTGLSQSILGSGTLDNATSLYPYNDGLLLASGSNAAKANAGYMYGYDKSTDKWATVGPYANLQTSTRSIAISSSLQKNANSAYDSTSNLLCTIWHDADTNNIIAQVTDYSTGLQLPQVLIGDTNNSDDRPLLVVAFNNNFVVIYWDNTTNNILYKRIATSAPTAVAASGTIFTTGSSIALGAVVANSRLYVATGSLKIAYLDTSWALSAITTITGYGAATSSHSLCADDSGNIGVASSGGTNGGYAAVFSSSLATVLAATALIGSPISLSMAGICFANGKFHAYMSQFTTPHIYYARFTTAAVTTNLTLFVRRTQLAAKPFVYNGNIFVIGLPNISGQLTNCIFMHYADCDDVVPNCIVGSYARDIIYKAPNDNWRCVPQVNTISTGVFQVAFLQQTGKALTSVASLTNIQNGTSASCTMDFTKLASSAQIANCTHISGSQLWLYDGQNITEHGFYFTPVILGAVAAGGGSIGAGTYQYIAIYEWIDGQGLTHRSTPSLPTSKTTTAGQQVTVNVSMLNFTNKRGSAFGVVSTSGLSFPTADVFVRLYRTTNAGSIFYYTGAYTVNDITVDDTNSSGFTAIIDTAADATIINNLELYTTGGVVDNTIAPPNLAVAAYRNRLVVVPSEDPYSWWFSQPVLPDSGDTSATPVEMSNFLIQTMDQDGGALSGVTTMDDKLIFTKATSLFYVVGNGPATDGSGSDFTVAQKITSPVGCVDQKSIVQSPPMGVIFQAANSGGIWLLDRSLGVSYLGFGVEAYNSQNVVSGAVCAPYNQVRFAMSGGIVLVYDYFVKQWSVFTGLAAVQACLFQGAFTFVKSNGQVYQESTSVFADNGTAVVMKIDTSWIQLAGLQGFQRIYEALILGDYESAHTLNANVYYDYDTTTPAQSTAITPTSTPPYQWRLLLNRQKCEAIRIELYDSANSGGEAMRLSGVSLKVGVKGGLNKMQTSRTFE